VELCREHRHRHPA